MLYFFQPTPTLSMDLNVSIWLLSSPLLPLLYSPSALVHINDLYICQVYDWHCISVLRCSMHHSVLFCFFIPKQANITIACSFVKIKMILLFFFHKAERFEDCINIQTLKVAFTTHKIKSGVLHSGFVLSKCLECFVETLLLNLRETMICFVDISSILEPHWCGQSQQQHRAIYSVYVQWLTKTAQQFSCSVMLKK